MTGLNALQKELVRVGLAEKPKERKMKYKQFKCHKCHNIMTRVPDSNIMYCDRCGQYFLFDKVV